MFVPSHIASGYLAGKIAKDDSKWIVLWVVAATIQDIDGFWSNSVAEHHSMLHTPIFWIILCGVGWYAGYFMKSSDLQKGSLVFFGGAMIHLITDWLTARTVGIQWFYPLSVTNYFVYPIFPEKGNIPILQMLIPPYINYYFENKVLAYGEVAVNLAAFGWLGKTYLGRK